MSQKGFALVPTIITVLVVVFLGWYLYTQNTSNSGVRNPLYPTYSSQAECERVTGVSCHLYQSLCQTMASDDPQVQEQNKRFIEECTAKNGTWQPNVDPGEATTNWQTYRNEEYGFEVKYPPSWEVTPNIGYVGIANSEGGINIDSRIAGYNSTLGRDLTAEDLTLTRGSKVEKTEIILDGVTATKIAYCYGLSPIIGIVAEKYGRFYKIGVEPWNIGGCEDSSGPIIPVFNKSIFNEILSTFKFVESDELSVSELKSESHSQVVLFEKDPITVFLYAPNEEVEILSDSFCAGNKGDKVFKGDYQLISVKSGAIISRLDLNLFSRGLFEGLRHDGLDILNGSKIPLVTITQYASCNGSFTQLFHVDESGTIKPAQFTEVGGVVFQDIFGYQLSIDGENLTNCFYNNADPDVGNVCNIYRFDGENFLFVQKL